MDTPLRKCSRCEREKPASDFRQRSRKLASGERFSFYEARCRSCSEAVRRPTAPPRANWLPVDPFRDWLLDRLKAYGTMTALAEACGVPFKTVDRILNENKWADLGVVDKCLCTEGTTSLCELYPLEMAA